MTSTGKQPKEKIYATGPKLTPRPTAASAARAARNATNRTNLATPIAQRQSPTRAPASPASSKIRTAIQRNGNRSDSKTEIKINRNCEVDYIPQENASAKRENDIIEIDNETVEILHNPEEHIIYKRADNLDIHETETFEVINDHENSNSTEADEPVLDCEEKKLPPTPAISRPQTPKSIPSRPQTPRLPSRPNTPAHPLQRPRTPISRPNTPQRCTPATRPQTPSAPSALPRPTTPKAVHNPPPSPNKDYDDIKVAYSTKQKQFHRMKKELDLKQQAILEVFDGLRSIRDHMVREGLSAGGEGLVPQELVVFNIADWAADEISQLCRDAIASSSNDGVGEIFNTAIPMDECALEEVESRALNVPSCFADLCLQAFTARQELIDWVKDLVNKSDASCNEDLERIARYNSQGLELCDTLREIKSRADNVVDTITLLSKRVCRERNTLIAVGESLVREVARLRQELESRAEIVNEVREMRAETETSKLLEEVRRELEEERTVKATLKDKLATTESQLRQTRIRISKMDRQLRESEASISGLTGTVKTLEDQSRQREVHLEARARKLKESLKTGEVTSSQIAQQRDALQTEVNELKEQIQALSGQHKSEVQELQNKLKDVMASLDVEHKTAQNEMTTKQELETSLKMSQKNIEELNAKITELENSRPNPDLPTEREMDLWAELHAVKDTLRITEEEVTVCKREKVRFLETLTKIAESENKMGMQQKLAAELLSKEEILAKMQTQIRELTKNIKLNEQKVVQYEQYVRDLQAHNRAVANCQEAPNGISYQDLQQEIMSLRMGLLDAVHRNEELSEMLAQKEQQLEQQDKTSRAQARVIKVREELINMLKNKETEQSRELTTLQHDLEHRMKIVDEVNKQIAAKADEIQELFATLGNKQDQIHRLEKIVLALEEQQRRAQAQRTRHEEKIAALEHELAAGINRKERKFLFF